ncbi:MAG TPA: YggS family pyridoxal phosphate-dependent enzyme, partial [Verrucomicrobiae bacterium]|nr:YggS family pyridoxal phosphate-dependent enzyme [Verrucomicrobiae bacterium]
MVTQTSLIAVNFARVQERVALAAERAGRAAGEVTIVAVSKTFSVEAIRAAYDAGLRHFGENRVQEFEPKRAKLSDLGGVAWHFIGHLQSNKAHRAVHLFDRIDCVDSLSLAHKLDTAAATEHKRIPVLIEVRLSHEATKSGVAESDLRDLADYLSQSPHVDLRGLMTIPPYSDDPDEARPYFRRLRALRDRLREQLALPLPVLSMGMSHDFEVAIEEGATEIRVGTAL